MNEERESTNEVTTNQPDGSTPSIATRWRYRSVPDDPEKHEEFDQRAGESPEGLRIIGARVRGKKHKHEGTNCDDWFEFCTSGPWTIITVSDGAGSKVFSRVGARTSCQAAMEHLRSALANHNLSNRERWSPDVFERDKQTGVFIEKDVEYIQEALHAAMLCAYEAVEAKAQSLAQGEHRQSCFNLLGHEVTADDLSATLLLAVHTTVLHEGIQRSFVATCQVGDGMLAVLDSNGGPRLLGIPDSGDFAGQTEFLTSRKKLEKANLTSKTFVFFGQMRALLVMTDGVADDYFPNDPGMTQLFGDLAINGIVGPRLSDLKSRPEAINSILHETQLKDTAAVENAELASAVETITEEGRGSVLIRSVKTYAEKLGLQLDDVIKSAPLLIAGTAGDGMSPEEKPEDRLRVWLDSYQVRGSFDDRTLVVLYREVLI